jgi:hypothetical protein
MIEGGWIVKSSRGLMLVVLTVLIGTFGIVESAAGNSKAFCTTDFSTGGAAPPNLPAGGSCVGPGNSTLTMVRVTTYVVAQHCAVGKANSNGSGSNVIPASCGNAKVQQTPCVPPVNGYPKGTNSTNIDLFMSGIKWWNNCYN